MFGVSNVLSFAFNDKRAKLAYVMRNGARFSRYEMMYAVVYPDADVRAMVLEYTNMVVVFLLNIPPRVLCRMLTNWCENGMVEARRWERA